MASVSLVSSPPTPVVVLDKNMTDSELAEEERSSNILICLELYLLYPLICASQQHACVTVVL